MFGVGLAGGARERLRGRGLGKLRLQIAGRTGQHNLHSALRRERVTACVYGRLQSHVDKCTAT